jgi:chromosome segregation ATPase
VENNRRHPEVRVATKTIDDTWAEIRRQIDELEARTEGGQPRTQARLQARLHSLRAEEASAWEAVYEKAEAVDEKVRKLEIDIAIAENRLASELADDTTSFAEAAEAELHDWDGAIERLQTRAATKTQAAREQAEAEIAALRRVRNRAAEQVTALPGLSGSSAEQRDRITNALDELERRVRAAALTIK